MISSSQTNGQCLPGLQPSSATLQTITRSYHDNIMKDNKTLDPAMKNTTRHVPSITHNAVQIKSDPRLNDPPVHKVVSTEDEATEKVTTQKSSSPQIDKKKDKKIQARKYLVEGLSTPQHGGNSGRRLYRNNTFNHQQCATFNQNRAQRSLNPRHHRSHDGTNNGDQLHFNNNNGIGNFPKEDTSSKVKKAIENWNELVMELQSEQYRRLNSYDGQFSLDSNSSSDEDVPSPIHKDRHRKHLYAPHSLLPVPAKSSIIKADHITKYNPNPFSLSFAKYRPITPGLLLDLDKQKLSSKKKTQRWINQLEVQSRSYHGVPSRKLKQNEAEVEDSTSSALLGESIGLQSTTHASGSVTVSPISVRPLLHRTESYGSTRTRQSILSQNKNQHGFL